MLVLCVVFRLRVRENGNNVCSCLCVCVCVNQRNINRHCRDRQNNFFTRTFQQHAKFTQTRACPAEPVYANRVNVFDYVCVCVCVSMMVLHLPFARCLDHIMTSVLYVSVLFLLFLVI